MCLKFRKIVFTKPGVVEMQTGDIDEKSLEDKDVLIKKYYSLISAGTEIACLAGTELWFPLPATPGYSGVGEIMATGSKVENFRIGDMVYYRGKHCEYESVSSDSLLLKLSKDAPLKYIPIVTMAAISSSAIWASNIEYGDDVAVVGQGLIGLTALLQARMQGARVIAIDPSEKRLEIARKCGADFVLNPVKANVTEEINAITCGRKVTTMIDATGNAKAILDNLNNIAWGGELILLGSPRKPYEANVTELLQHIHQFRFNVDVKGAHEFRYPEKECKYVKHSAERTSRILIDYITGGKLDVSMLVTQVEAPENAAGVYKQIANGNEDYLGVIFDWTN